MKIICIIGSGVMGKGIAVLSLIAQCKTIVYCRNSASIEKTKNSIVELLETIVQKHQLNSIKKLLTVTSSVNDFHSADIVIETIIENGYKKMQIYKKIEKIISKRAILASNTSSLSIEKLGSNLRYPDRFIGLHFFNPAHKMNLVEITKTHRTSKTTLHKINVIARLFGKNIISLRKDSHGFIVNRILFRMLSEAIKLRAEGVASIEDIDKAIELGLKHPMGPFKLMDLIGLDVCFAIFENLLHAHDKKEVITQLKYFMDRGYLGKKTNKGFYSY